MNRRQFMNALERLLRDIPENEREEALQYYNDYFDDAGEENEASVIEELGSPQQVARTIREGMNGSDGEYTENGYEDSRFRNHQDISPDYQPVQETNTREKKSGNPWKLLCIILVCLILGPIVIPLGIGLLAVIAGLVIAAICLIGGVGLIGFVPLLVGIAAIVVGIIRMAVFPSVGFALLGIGCLALALGILTTLLTVWIFTKLVPGIIRGIVALIRFPLRKAGVVK